MNPFYEQIYDIVRQIPYGRVVSYGQISRMLGRPRSARMVGRAISCCKQPLPWHRVVMSDGLVAGGYHAELRREMLRAEGVAFLPNGNVNMELCRWSGRPNTPSTSIEAGSCVLSQDPAQG